MIYGDACLLACLLPVLSEKRVFANQQGTIYYNKQHKTVNGMNSVAVSLSPFEREIMEWSSILLGPTWINPCH